MVFRGALHARAGAGHASLVDFCNPRATCEHDLESSEPRAPHSRSPGGEALFCGWLRRLSEALPTGRYRARDRAARHYAVCVASLETIARLRGLRPNPNRPRHPLSQARDAAGWSFADGIGREVIFDAPSTSSPTSRRTRRRVAEKTGPLARARLSRAAFRTLSRKRERSAAPEVPSITGRTPWGWDRISTTCPQAVENIVPDAFSIAGHEEA
jgi:hypothetical protein